MNKRAGSKTTSPLPRAALQSLPTKLPPTDDNHQRSVGRTETHDKRGAEVP